MFIPHITIYTAKMEESIAFYQDVAKLQIVADQRPRAPIVFSPTARAKPAWS